MDIPNNNIQKEKREFRLHEHPWLSLLAVIVTTVFSIGLSDTVIFGLMGLPDDTHFKMKAFQMNAKSKITLTPEQETLLIK